MVKSRRRLRKRTSTPEGEIAWLRDDAGRDLRVPRSPEFVLRYPAETQLPWVLAVASPGADTDWAARRQLLLVLLAVVALFALTGGYIVLSALRREFALARMQSDFVSAVSLFSRFFRDEAAQRAGIRGAGIGLARVTQIVAAHGGSVSVESEPGRGSTFTISLPMEAS